MSRQDKIDVKYLLEQYQMGRTAKSLAEEFNCSNRMICDRLRPFGVLRHNGRKVMTYEERMASRKKFDQEYNKTKAHAEAHKRRHIKDKQKVAARWTVQNAVNSGELPSVKTLLCKDCNKPAQAYDHYMGYEKENWLKVEPVCARCNKARDKR